MTYKQQLESQIAIDSKNLRLILSGEKIVRMKEQIIIGLNVRILSCEEKFFNLSLEPKYE